MKYDPQMASLFTFGLACLLQAHGQKLDYIKGFHHSPLQLLEDMKQTCWTPECLEAAHIILSSVNQSVDPCRDFYEFSCGGWVRNNPVLPTEPHRNQFDAVTEKLDQQLREILEEEEDPNELEPVNAARLMYKTCMDTVKIEDEGLSPLVALIDQYGGWPMAQDSWEEERFHWQSVVASLTRHLGLTPVFSVYVYFDRINTSTTAITIDQPSLVLARSMLVEPNIYTLQLDTYKNWVKDAALELAKFQNCAVPRSRIIADVTDLVSFEIELAKLTSPSEMRRNVHRMYNPMTLWDVQEWTDSARPRNSHAKIIWKQLLQEVFQDVNVSVTYQEKILVKEVDYLFELVKLLDRTPPRVLGNFLVWCVVRKLSRDSNQRMRELGFQMDRVISGLQEDLPRWRDCAMLTSTSLSFAVGYKYVSRHFDNRAKKSALQMLNNIREAFMRQVDRLEWMDTATRQVAQDKARLMTELVGYPDWFTNKTAFLEFHAGIRVGKNHLQNVVNLERLAMHQMLSKLHQPVERKEWECAPEVVNAFYVPQTNSILFPAAVLQPPFFKKGRLEALNYGSIGVVIGHEITHGFDDMGRQTDKYGNLAQWWTSSTTDTYLKKAQCFIDQYNSYRVPELDSMVRREVKMNGVITQGENMADLGGLRQAYLAYKTLVRETGVEPRLPGLQEYSPEQLFFIGFGMVWCESTTKESLLQEVLSDPHSPHRLRVYGTLSNSPEFSQVWGCPSGSPMNPRHKCDLW